MLDLLWDQDGSFSIIVDTSVKFLHFSKLVDTSGFEMICFRKLLNLWGPKFFIFENC